jgi:signal transduction histidine kinase
MLIGTDWRSPSLQWVSRDQTTENGRIYQLETAEPCGHSEADLKAKAPEVRLSRSCDEAQRALCELELQQIELALQHAEMRLARDEVDTSLEMYRDLYDFAPVSYLTFDREGVIRAVNLTGCALLGTDRSRLLGRRFGQFVAEEARPAFAAFLDKVLAGAGKVGCEVPLANRPRFVQIEGVAALGQLCHAVIIDISVRRGLEVQQEILHAEVSGRASRLEVANAGLVEANTGLADANAELMDANLELEAFNYTVSHDLRSPLTGINGFAQLLLRINMDQLDEQSRGYLRRIYNGTLRMQRLISSLLDFSRIAHVELHRESFDMSEMAQSVAAHLSLGEPENRVVFQVVEGVMGNADAALCHILLENLIGNAWKFTVDRVATIIQFGVTELGGEPVYYVRDNGPGFDMAQAEKLFVPFQRIPGIDAEGHGIGLATVKRIVRRHGGRVWVESCPGGGATFFYTLGLFTGP